MKKNSKNDKSFGSVVKSSFERCTYKHTGNFDGFMGSKGDMAAFKCVVDSVADYYADKAIEKMGDSGNNDSGGDQTEKLKYLIIFI